MDTLTRTATVVTKGSATQDLPGDAAQVNTVTLIKGGTTSVDVVSYTIKDTAATSATEVQFTGTAHAPSKQLTFDSSVASSGVLTVDYVLPGAVPASK